MDLKTVSSSPADRVCAAALLVPSTNLDLGLFATIHTIPNTHVVRGNREGRRARGCSYEKRPRYPLQESSETSLSLSLSLSNLIRVSRNDYPKPGELNTVETWAERLNAQGISPNNHCTIVDCGGTSTMNG
jgi:hypothetical protein